MKFARLKPYNGKAHVLRSFTVFGIKFQEKNGWYQVEDDVAEYLKTVVQVQEDPTSAKGFDVVDSLEEAEEIDELEKKRAQRAAAAEARPTAAKRVHSTSASRTTSGDLTTADLKKPASGHREKGFDEMSDKFDDDMAGSVKKITPVLDGADDEEPTEPVTKATTDESEEGDEEEETTKVSPSKAPPAPRGRGRR